MAILWPPELVLHLCTIRPSQRLPGRDAVCPLLGHCAFLEFVPTSEFFTSGAGNVEGESMLRSLLPLLLALLRPTLILAKVRVPPPLTPKCWNCEPPHLHLAGSFGSLYPFPALSVQTTHSMPLRMALCRALSTGRALIFWALPPGVTESHECQGKEQSQMQRAKTDS